MTAVGGSYVSPPPPKYLYETLSYPEAASYHYQLNQHSLYRKKRDTQDVEDVCNMLEAYACQVNLSHIAHFLNSIFSGGEYFK